MVDDHNPARRRLDGRVVLISGGLGEIGQEIARRMLHEGAKVALADLEARVADGVGDGFEGLPAPFLVVLDVTRAEDWSRAIDRTVAHFGRLDVLVNNAGTLTTVSQAFDDIEYDEWRRVFAINVDGVFLGTQAAMRHMKSGGGGAIVNMGSIAGYIGSKDNCTYSTSKGAVRSMSKSAALSAALNGYGVRVNTVHPGFVWTRLISEKAIRLHGSEEKAIAAYSAMNPSGRMVRPSDVAAAVAFLASDDSGMINGADLVVDGGRLIQ